MTDKPSVAQAVAAVTEAAHVEAAATVEAVVADAAAQVAQAQEIAQNIVEAAQTAPLAQAVAELQKENEDADEWESQIERQLAALEGLVQSWISKVEAMLNEPKPVVTIIPPTAEPSLIQPPLPEPEIPATVITVEPGAVKPGADADALAAQVPKTKRGTRLI